MRVRSHIVACATISLDIGDCHGTQDHPRGTLTPPGLGQAAAAARGASREVFRGFASPGCAQHAARRRRRVGADARARQGDADRRLLRERRLPELAQRRRPPEAARLHRRARVRRRQAGLDRCRAAGRAGECGCRLRNRNARGRITAAGLRRPATLAGSGTVCNRLPLARGIKSGMVVKHRSGSPPPPAATVTFLFTDIEGSTRLWEAQREAMTEALRRHDELLRQCIESRGGHIFKTGGDAFCAAFATAASAAEAALAAQRSLHAERWPDQAAIRARMALHTGVAESRDGDYFGPPLNHVARLLAAAHGGQTLVSALTHDLCRDWLPAGTTLKSLGEHGLKDLTLRDTVFQLSHTALQLTYPVLKHWIAPLDADTPSIAVLPFTDLSPEKDQEYFTDGLAEELL